MILNNGPRTVNDLDMPKGSQPPSRQRFYIGSAAIFWFVVALLIWLRLFFKPPIFKNDDVWWAGWSLASYASAPAFFMALLAIFIRNQSTNAVPAWLITPPVFVFIIYMQLKGIKAMLFQCAICPAVVVLVLVSLVGLSIIADRHGSTFDLICPDLPKVL